FGRNLQAWALTADWNLALAPALDLSGEAFRGRSIGGLWGGIGTSIVSSTPDLTQATTQIAGVNAAGGWTQLKFHLSPSLQFNAAYGLDNAFAADVERFEGTNPNYPLARNHTALFNFIDQPRSDLVLALEYRRIYTTPFVAPTLTAGRSTPPLESSFEALRCCFGFACGRRRRASAAAGQRHGAASCRVQYRQRGGCGLAHGRRWKQCAGRAPACVPHGAEGQALRAAFASRAGGRDGGLPELRSVLPQRLFARRRAPLRSRPLPSRRLARADVQPAGRELRLLQPESPNERSDRHRPQSLVCGQRRLGRLPHPGRAAGRIPP